MSTLGQDNIENTSALNLLLSQKFKICLPLNFDCPHAPSPPTFKIMLKNLLVFFVRHSEEWKSFADSSFISITCRVLENWFGVK